MTWVMATPLNGNEHLQTEAGINGAWLEYIYAMPDNNKFTITFDSSILRDDAEALSREWILANGIGGYASSTLAGANTRRYHALLCAALNPPLGRAVLLSKLDETVHIVRPDGTEASINLSCNLYPGVCSPQGHRLLISWRSLPVPAWIWEVEPGLKIEKQIWTAKGSNTVCISYRLLELPAGTSCRLQLVPLMAWRDYHSEMAACSVTLPSSWNQKTSLLLLDIPPIQQVTEKSTTLYLRLSDLKGNTLKRCLYCPEPEWYYNFQYPREEERGFNHSEDLYTPGSFTIPLVREAPMVLTAGVAPLPKDPPDVILANHVERYQHLLKTGGLTDTFGGKLLLAADLFPSAPPRGRSTIMAGFPWFGDWGRDTMISLPGICLATGRYKAAADILNSFAGFADQGMMPNRFPDAGQAPEYNTVDAALWFVIAVYRLMKAADIPAPSGALWPTLQQIIWRYATGTRCQIHVDQKDGLLYAGESGVQLTWMDAKVGDWVVTPRIGKPVEINALWVSALRIMAEFTSSGDQKEITEQYSRQAERAAQSFLERFVRPDGNGLYDVLDTPPNSVPDASIRPNQIFALSLPFAPIPANHPAAQSILDTVRNHLYTPVGLRTLSPSDPSYKGRYEGDPMQRDSAYHQGSAWPWLLGPYAEAVWKVTGDVELAISVLRPLEDQMNLYGIGSLAEVYDGSEPQRPGGCFAQAWSVAEALRVWKLLNKGE